MLELFFHLDVGSTELTMLELFFHLNVGLNKNSPCWNCFFILMKVRTHHAGTVFPP